jgi:FkbM family methyltransferase
MMPTKFLLARAVCRNLPPIVAQRVRELIYPRKAAYADNFMFSVKAVTGSEFMGTTQDHHAYPFSVHGYYEWRSWAIAASLCSQGDTIIEVGANLGTETVGFSDIVGPKGKVIAFEPSPANANALKQAVNKFRFTNVEVQEVAVGKNSGKTRFLTSKVKTNSGSGHVAFENGKENGFDEIEIGIITLDSLMDQLKNVIYIHMDAEGSELFVLEGANNLIKRDQPQSF